MLADQSEKDYSANLPELQSRTDISRIKDLFYGRTFGMVLLAYPGDFFEQVFQTQGKGRRCQSNTARFYQSKFPPVCIDNPITCNALTGVNSNDPCTQLPI